MRNPGTCIFVYHCNYGTGYPAAHSSLCCRSIRIVKNVLLLIIIVSSLPAFLSPAAALDWITETVDSNGDTGWYTSLALDSAGNPRISYLDWTKHHLKYAAKSDGVWMTETVDRTNTSGDFCSLKLDHSGQPFISYYDGNQGNLSFALKSGDIWTHLIVDTGGVGRYTSLALDNHSYAHISYQDLLNMKLKYAEKSGDHWVIETVDNSGNVGTYSSLALDNTGKPHVSYYDAGHGYLKYAEKTGNTWITMTVDNTGNAGYYTSMGLNASGNPGISYYDGINKDLKYATKSGNVWIKEIVDRAGNVGLYTSLAYDNAGNPHISYYDSTNGHLKYAVKSGNTWTNETVDSAINTGQYSSLVLDNLDNPRISYRSGLDGDLRFSTGFSALHLNFTATPQYGTSPLFVRFNETSEGGLPSLWNWSFGDGTWFNTSSDSLRNPGHIFETPGVYTVNLTVNTFNLSSTLSHSGFITVTAPDITPPYTTIRTPDPTVTSTPGPTLIPDPTSIPDPTLIPTTTLTFLPTFSPDPTKTPSFFPTLIPDPAFTPTSTHTPIPTFSPDPSIGPSISPTLSSKPTVSPSLTFTFSPAPSPFPAVNGEGSDAEYPVPSAIATGLPVSRTINVGGDSAIRCITVTGQGLSSAIFTALKVTSPPTGVSPVNMTVYQYINILPARCGVISSAQIEFAVPRSVINEHHTKPVDVKLYRFNMTSWGCLSTSMLESQNGQVIYRAESQDFSLFAITLPNGTFAANGTEEIKPAAGAGISVESQSSKPLIQEIRETPKPFSESAYDTGFPSLMAVVTVVPIIGIFIFIVFKKFGRIHR